MNATTNFTIKSLRANRVRTFVTIIGVALAAALLMAVMTTYTSLTDFLYRTEAATSGTWMAKVASEDSGTLAADLATAQGDPTITDTSVLHDVGFAELTPQQQDRLGRYQTILSGEGNMETVLGVHASEGRLPENDHEILLFEGWKTREGLAVGDEVTFNVGRRVAVPVEGEESSVMTHGEVTVGVESVGDNEIDIVAGTPLNSSVGYLDAEVDGSTFNEGLVDLHEQTYTVVGFYERVNYAMYTGTGVVALTYGAPADTSHADVFLVMDDVQDSKDVKEKAQALFPDDHIELHSALLRFMGISSDTSLWTTFYGLIIVLSTVIILACVSLIFNAFAISVAERASQFGLLSSVGATRRQLRRAVILEAFCVAIIGIPLGVIIGLGGCAATFAILGPAISQIAGNGVVPFELAVNPAVVLIAVVLTLMTVFLSVWIPARRASSTTIIDSLKSAHGSRVSKRGEKQAAKATNGRRLWRSGGIVGRAFGVGGKLAKMNRKRGAVKGRTAAVSLALAIVLLMTAGSLNTFLGSLVNTVTGGYVTAGDVSVSAQFMSTQAATYKEPFDGPITAEELLQVRNEQFASEAQAFKGVYDHLSETPEPEPKGWTLSSSLPVVLPREMAGSAFSASKNGLGGPMQDGDCAAIARVRYVDDAAFDAYVRELGGDPSIYHDVAHPRAVGVSRAYGNDGSTYQLLTTLQDTGTVEAIGGAVYEGRYPAVLGISEGGVMIGGSMSGATSTDGEPWDFVPSFPRANDDVYEQQPTMEDIEYVSIDLEISALADEPPAVVGSAGESLMLVMPMSLAATQGFGMEAPYFEGQFDAAGGDHEQLAEDLYTRGTAYFHDEVPYDLAFCSYNDRIAEMDTTQMLATIVNVFCLLFTVILALIAMANVFNTVTNSLILRRREFAVMRSIGLSNRQFRRMITDECMSFGIAGLIPGLVISAGISYLLYAVIGQSMEGLMFNLPWGYVGLAVAMTVLAMGVSVAYGMHRCKADNVVEALRSDSI